MSNFYKMTCISKLLFLKAVLSLGEESISLFHPCTPDLLLLECLHMFVLHLCHLFSEWPVNWHSVSVQLSPDFYSVVLFVLLNDFADFLCSESL